MRRFWKWILPGFLILLVLVSLLYITILGPALQEVNLGMCKTYYADDPECIRRLQNAVHLPRLSVPEK